MPFSSMNNKKRALVGLLLAALFLLPFMLRAQSMAGGKPMAKPPMAATPAAKLPNLKPGLEARAWHYGTAQLPALPEVPKDLLPNVVHVVPAMDIADYKKNFGWIGQQAGIYGRYGGYLLVPTTRSYAFRLRSAHGSRLTIDGQTIIDRSTEMSLHEKDAEVYLEAGYHAITVEHFKNHPPTYKEITLWWVNEQQKWEYVPASQFFHIPGDARVDKEYKVLSADGVSYRPGHYGAPLDKVHPSYSHSVLSKESWAPKVAGMDFLPDGRLVVSTWDSLGQVFVVSKPETGDSNQVEVKRIAWGLAEPLGLKVVGGQIYILQKHELTRLVDTDNDGLIDDYQTVCNSWGVTGNFHEFAFGLEYKDGFFYGSLAIAINPGGRSTIPQNKDRGRCVKMGMDGSLEVIATGLRTPNTIGTGVENELFIADNQGDWLPACKLVHLKKGAFYNNYAVDLYEMGKKDVARPVVWFPQNEIGNSTSQPTVLNDGPYKNQMLAGDVHYGGLQRIYIEKVGGEYQGCVFKFSQGLSGGTNRLRWGPDGALYIGCVGSNGNWGQYGKKLYGLDRIKFNGKTTFEMLAVRARQNGFEIEFTKPLANPKALQTKHIALSHWRYVPTMQYGGPKQDKADLAVLSLNPSADGKTVFVEVEGLEEDRVVFISLNPDAVKSADGEMLWSSEAYYTLNNLPQLMGKGGQRATTQTKPAAGKTGAQAAAKPAAPAAAKPAAPAKSAEDDAAMIAKGAQLVATKQCKTCHGIDQKILGPAFKDVAMYYRTKAGAEKHLNNKIANGGSGVWGDQAMPPQYHVSKEEIARMVKYIMSLK